MSTTRARLTAADRRESIVEAAREVFCEVGLRGARVRAIAERAGITEPLLYRHFSSRDELYRVAVEDHFIQLLDAAVTSTESLVNGGKPGDRTVVKALNALYLQVMMDIAPLAAVALYEDQQRGRVLYQAEIRPRLRRAASALYRSITGNPLPDGMENVVAVSLFGVSFGAALDSMLRGE